MYDTGIADRLRAAGLKIIEVDGWKTRGRTSSPAFDPRGYVHHHTGGGPSGNAPSLNICINGRSDLPGPLCNIFQARDNTIYVIAAGKANHAGPGSWNGLSGNNSVYGNEVENTGTEPWRQDQHETAAKAARALLGPGKAAWCCEHKEWSTQGKVDAHTITGPTFRALVQKYDNVVQPQEDDMLDAEDKAAIRDVIIRTMKDDLAYDPLWNRVAAMEMALPVLLAQADDESLTDEQIDRLAVSLSERLGADVAAKLAERLKD